MKKIIKLYQIKELEFIKKPCVIRVLSLLGLLSLKLKAFADIPTPAPGDDPTQAGSGFLQVLFNIVAKEAIPILLYGGTVVFVVGGIFEIFRGYKKAMEAEDIGKFFLSIVIGLICISIGISAFFFAQYIDKNWINGG